MKNEELLELIRLGENQTVDFKDSAILSNPNSIAKLMVAFANTMGGKIIFGIKNNKKFEGLKFKGGHEMTIMNIARDKCDPPFHLILRLTSLKKERYILLLFQDLKFTHMH